MSSVVGDLAALLSGVRRPGDFFASGSVELLAPGLEVEGVGPIALPLLPVQVAQLVAAAERAPFGRGEKTLIDTAVRRTWQIDASAVRVTGKHWARTLETMLARVADGLGVSDPITAELYKLLVYDEGSFFVGHRDTEKAPGMFATLVVALPSTSTGGELRVRHKGREARLDLRSEDPSEAAFAAFYADCVHEVLPVTSGCRLVMVYNLLRKSKGPAPEPPSYEAEQVRAVELLRQWVDSAPSEQRPEKLVYPLEHAYTPAELSFATLKGADAAAAAVLKAAAPQTGCDIHLALLSVHESGAAEYVDTGRSRRGGWAEPELEAGDVDDRWATLSEWRRPDGSSSPLGELPFEENELSPPDAFEDVDADEVEFEEATGNAGATFERSYSRAALVLWPRQRFFAVLNQAGLSVTLPYLDDLAQRWRASGEGRESSLWRDAHELGRCMTSDWPESHGHWHRKEATELARMLDVLRRLDDSERIAALLARVAAGGHWHRNDNEAAIAAVGAFPPAQRAALIACIVTGTADTSPDACADLLVRAIAAERAEHRGELHGAVTALVDALPGDPMRASRLASWQQPVQPESGFLTDLFTVLAHFDEALAQRAADRILERRKTYGLDSMLIPAVLRLSEPNFGRTGAVERLRRACVENLRARVAEPLAAPADWARASDVGCKCAHCGELRGFLADRERRIWVLKAVEAQRRHVEDVIERARCDLDTRTDHQGRPYALVCTKNQVSYERRANQRSADLANLAKLTA